MGISFHYHKPANTIPKTCHLAITKHFHSFPATETISRKNPNSSHPCPFTPLLNKFPLQSSHSTDSSKHKRKGQDKSSYAVETKMDPLGNQNLYTDENGNPVGWFADPHRFGGFHKHGTGDQHLQGHGTTGDVDHHSAGGFGEHGNGNQHLPGQAPTGYADHHATGGLGQHGNGAQELHGGRAMPGVLRRSGSASSSSSSEDDGFGGRRKKNKGVKDKIKEKLPGGHKNDQNPQQYCDQRANTGARAPEIEKKGIMEKIKEKLPGSHSL